MIFLFAGSPQGLIFPVLVQATVSGINYHSNFPWNHKRPQKM